VFCRPRPLCAGATADIKEISAMIETIVFPHRYIFILSGNRQDLSDETIQTLSQNSAARVSERPCAGATACLRARYCAALFVANAPERWKYPILM
jgi:hypothetical protein